jgi:hypothetical protein
MQCTERHGEVQPDIMQRLKHFGGAKRAVVFRLAPKDHILRCTGGIWWMILLLTMVAIYYPQMNGPVVEFLFCRQWTFGRNTSCKQGRSAHSRS